MRCERRRPDPGTTGSSRFHHGAEPVAPEVKHVQIRAKPAQSEGRSVRNGPARVRVRRGEQKDGGDEGGALQP